MARPRKAPRNAPATPMSMVTMTPPGSRPGMMSLATTPTIRPNMSVQRMFIVTLLDLRVHALAGEGSKFRAIGRRGADRRRRTILEYLQIAGVLRVLSPAERPEAGLRCRRSFRMLRL